MLTQDFDYDLPLERIAQMPLIDRTAARLLTVDRLNGSIEDHHIRDLPSLLQTNDVLVFNETKVFPARLRGVVNGKTVELLLHQPLDEQTWSCLAKPGKRLTQGVVLEWEDMKATVVQIQPDGSRWIRFSRQGVDLETWIDTHGETPLPPYLKESTADAKSYQTVYAKHRGSVAAPTAGLHFTPELLNNLKKKGVETLFVTLHVGRGTFEPVKVDRIQDHTMHEEPFYIDASTAERLNAHKKAGKRIIAVGTTSARTLESAASNGILRAGAGHTRLFITPGYSFQFIDGLLTNFHLPKSTLLMMVSALTGKPLMDKAYRHAIQNGYRFFSFGDAMLIL